MNARKIRRYVGIHEVPIGICAGIALCALALALVWHEAVKHTRQEIRLEQLGQEKKAEDAKIRIDRTSRDSVRKIAAAAVAAADTAARARQIARKKIALVGDTATTPSGTQVLLPEISDFIRSSDLSSTRDSAAKATQATLIQRQDTLEADHTRRESIDDQETEILDREKHPRCGIKCGAAIGAGAVILAVHFLSRAL
jgi:hypothetical protein